MAEDLTKLPKWAQSLVSNLTERAEKAEAQLAHTYARPGDDTNVVLRTRFGHPDINLPNGAVVRFSLERGNVDVRVDASGALEVHGNSIGASSLAIKPTVSNLVQIEVG